MSNEQVVVTYEDEEGEITLDNIYVVMVDIMRINSLLLSALVANSSDSVTEDEKEMIVHDALYKTQVLLGDYIDNHTTEVN
jgi:hypothetical protein